MKTITKHIMKQIWDLVTRSRLSVCYNLEHSLRYINFNYSTWLIRRYRDA